MGLIAYNDNWFQSSSSQISGSITSPGLNHVSAAATLAQLSTGLPASLPQPQVIGKKNVFRHSLAVTCWTLLFITNRKMKKNFLFSHIWVIWFEKNLQRKVGVHVLIYVLWTPLKMPIFLKSWKWGVFIFSIILIVKVS